MSELDSLLDDLNSEYPTEQNKINLDELMEELETPITVTADVRGPYSKQATPDDDDDGLESLMAEVAAQNQSTKAQAKSKPAAKQTKPASRIPAKGKGASASVQVEVDVDLDDLINDLTTDPAPPPVAAPTQRPPPQMVGKGGNGKGKGNGAKREEAPVKDYHEVSPEAGLDDTSLDALIGDLTTEGNAVNTVTTAKPKGPPAKNTKITAAAAANKPAVKPTTGPAKAAAPKPEHSEDFLNELMSDLTAGSTVQGKVGLKGATMAKPEPDEVDSLLHDLNTQTGSRPKSQHTVASHTDKQQQLELQSLMDELGGSALGGDNQPTELEALMAEMTATSPPAVARGARATGDPDFDAFLGELERGEMITPRGGSSAPPKAAPVAKPAANTKPLKSTPVKQELDALVSDLVSPTHGSELDSLMNGLEPAYPPPQQGKYNQPPQQTNNELEELMADLTVEPSRAPMKKTVPENRRPPKNERRSQVPYSMNTMEEIGEIYDQLDQPVRGGNPPPYSQGVARNPSANPVGGQGRGRAPAAPSGGADDLDDILQGLNEPTSQAFNNQGRPVSQQPFGNPNSNPYGGAQRVPDVTLPRGMCSGCRKAIVGESVQALGRSYHPDHFVCSTCGKNIGNGGFFEKEGQPQCDRCYQAVFCKRCASCDLPITNQLVTALGQSWHPKCFVCTDCASPFPGGSFVERDGRPFCTNCFYNVFSSRCRACGKNIQGNVLNALGASWHAEHFNCQACHAPFVNGQFYEVDSLPYCETHYRQLLNPNGNW